VKLKGKGAEKPKGEQTASPKKKIKGHLSAAGRVRLETARDGNHKENGAFLDFRWGEQ